MQTPVRAAFSSGVLEGAEEPDSAALRSRGAVFSYWSTSGYFEMKGGPPAAGNSWIIKHPTDGNAAFLETEFGLTERLSFDLAIGVDIFEDARVIDIDIDALGVVSDLSYSTSSGYLGFFGANVYLRAYKARSVTIDLSLGYLYMKSSVDYYDPNLKISNYLPSTVSWQERWLTYDLVHHGIRLGVRGVVNLDNSFSIKAGAGIIPWLQANYDGLRYPERPVALQQIERIEADGLGLDATISAEYAFYRGFLIMLGYRYISFETEGRDKAGTLWAGSREEFTMEVKGPFIAFGFNF
jgi:hypothetical protein